MGILCLRIERDGAAQVVFCFLQATQFTENPAEVGMSLKGIWGLLHGNAGDFKRLLIPFLIIQSLA